MTPPLTQATCVCISGMAVPWLQQGSSIVGEAADESGYAVSLSSDGKTLAVGSPYNDGNGLSAGHARVYVWDGSDWVQRGDDLDGEGAGDEFGKSVSLTGDGKTLAVGGPDNTNQGYTRGHVGIAGMVVRGFAWVMILMARVVLAVSLDLQRHFPVTAAR